eukprot:2930200-Prymnesium_polylepis.1
MGLGARDDRGVLSREPRRKSAGSPTDGSRPRRESCTEVALFAELCADELGTAAGDESRSRDTPLVSGRTRKVTSSASAQKAAKAAHAAVLEAYDTKTYASVCTSQFVDTPRATPHAWQRSGTSSVATTHTATPQLLE